MFCRIGCLNMKIGVVIVTYNRLDKLKKCLNAYANQTYLPVNMTVVNNASTDGTEAFLETWSLQQSSPFVRKVIHSDVNKGGAGGFKIGIAELLKSDVDWIWLADDDAYPESRCFENIVKFYSVQSRERKEEIVALCSRVNDNSGLSSLHRRRLKKTLVQIKEVPVELPEYGKDFFEIDFFSFVGTAIKAIAIKEIGLPRDDYFIYYDDSEYSLRVRKIGLIECISSAIVTHDSLENIVAKCSWKYYYMFRNKMYTYRINFSRRYCWVEGIKILYMIFKYYNATSTWKQWWCAQRDSKRGKLGKNSQYLPIKQEKK